MQRTVCFGSCPAYRVTIRDDGTVIYRGEAHVHVRGEQRATLAPRAVAELAAIIDQIRFFERDSAGWLPHPPLVRRDSHTTTYDFDGDVICGDTSRAVITVTRGGIAHTVTNSHCEPSALDRLEATIDDLARTARWVN